jgi:nucleolin
MRKKYSCKSETKEKKIFVGNVPYDGTQSEFFDCFKDIDGFINAVLIVNNETGISRGFGFVSMDSDKNIVKMKSKNIFFKNRILRFTNYQTNSNTYNYNHENNYIYVNNIPEGKNREWLKKCFNKYEPIGKYLILTNHQTGEYKPSGVIELIDDTVYNNLLLKKYIITDDKIKLNISRYKIQTYNNNIIY